MPILQIWLTDAEYKRLVHLKEKAPHMGVPQYAAQLIRERLDQLSTQEAAKA